MSEREMSNVDNVMKWIEALESGEFKQTIGQLESNGGYCCLGVAVVVAQRAGVEAGDNWAPMGSWADLPTVREFYGIDINSTGSCQPTVALHGDHRTRVFCSEVNDSWRLTFPQIAALLRAEYHLEGSDEQAAV